MTFWSWLLSEVLGAAFKGLNEWLSGQQAHADAVTTGQQSQKIADDASAVKAAQAEAQAVVDSPKDLPSVEGELDAGKF